MFPQMSFFSVTKSAMAAQAGRSVRFNMLQARTRHAICKKLNIRRVIGGDFKTLAAMLNMSNDDIAIISQKDDAAEQLFRWWELKREATVGKLQKILRRMRRDDILDILNVDPYVEGI